MQGLSEDQRLMARAQQDDRAAFDCLCQKYRSGLAAYCRRMLPNQDAAEDAAQQVLLRAWDKRDQYVPSGSFHGWLLTIAVNHCRNELRPRAVATVSAEEESVAEPADDQPGPEQSVLLRELLQAIYSQLRDDRDRAMFRLHYQCGMSAAEAAEALQMNLDTVKSRLRRMKDGIKQVMQERGYP